MAGKRQRANGSWEFKFQKKGVLPAPVYFTFDTLEEGEAYEARVEEMLDRGVVPVEMGGGTVVTTLPGLLDAYEAWNTLSESESGLLPATRASVEGVKTTSLTYDWVEMWVDGMKSDGLAPSTIRKRIGTLARAVDWGMRKGKVSLAANPLRLLPKGYVTKGVEKEKLWDGERDRRLEQTEEGAIRKVLVKKEEHLLFDMALETAMRMSEMLTLTVAQIDLGRRTIFLDRTKNGSRRQVPISSVLGRLLADHLRTLEGDWVFPEWGPLGKKVAANRVSHLFAARFEKAGCPDLRFHDLRHTATARFYERTRLSDLEIATITGHKDLRMLKRYANIRASVLAEKLW